MAESAACPYAHHAGVLYCQAQAPELPPPWAHFKLTPRERDVAALLLEGEPNKAIARRLGLEVQSVKNRVHAILGKTHASNRTRCAFALAGYVRSQF